MTRVAVVEDDPEYGDLLKMVLKNGGYEVSLFATPGKYFDFLLRQRPDVALIDLQLPGMDGKEIIRVMRSNPETRGVRIIAMTAFQKSTPDVVNGFHAGADEYLLKPLDHELLLIRIETLLRRGGDAGVPDETLRLDDLRISLDQRSVSLGGEPVSLTRLEFDLLVYLLRNVNRVLPRSVILESVWKGDPSMTTRTVDKHVETLRKKLGAFGKRIETVIRVGYVMKG
ncbi:MAG: response regulator transcription factor [Elusimicrobiota bacterium]